VKVQTPKANPDARFAPGNAAPANPFARRVAELRSALVEALTPGDVREIVVALTFRAKAGNVSAAKLLFQYALGKPLPATHPDRLDADEVQALKANAMSGDVVRALDATPAAPALAVLRDVQAGRAAEFFDELVADSRAKAAVTKREKTAVAQTESMRLVNAPAANGRS
jgi:hypothetical protein